MSSFFILFCLVLLPGTIFTCIDVHKRFKEAGVKGQGIFITICVLLGLIGVLTPLSFLVYSIYTVTLSDKTEFIYAMVVLGVFFLVCIGEAITQAAARKYANKRMPVFQPAPLQPTTAVMGSQGYSAPYMPYAPPAPQQQYYGQPMGGATQPMQQGYAYQPQTSVQPPASPYMQQPYQGNAGYTQGQPPQQSGYSSQVNGVVPPNQETQNESYYEAIQNVQGAEGITQSPESNDNEKQS